MVAKYLTTIDTFTTQGVQALDRYVYVNNSPVNFVDPTGRDLEQIIYNKRGELPRTIIQTPNEERDGLKDIVEQQCEKTPNWVGLTVGVLFVGAGTGLVAIGIGFLGVAEPAAPFIMGAGVCRP